jgi:ornithine cyclodeaminase/alanine dehydrogenase-like protein (mu-crystallin family)
MDITYIPFEQGQARLDWSGLTNALAEGHVRPKAEIADTFLYRDPDTLLSRSAWIDGLGLAVKSATVFPKNPQKGRPIVNGAFSLFSDSNGLLEALVDFNLVTKWKTAGDSLLAASRLARKESENILIIGAGTVGHSLRDAYGSLFPDATFTVWNRTAQNAEKMASEYEGMRVAYDLQEAVKDSDIITCATMSTEPVLRGDWLRPGQHIDLIGAYRPDMREADDAAILRARVFVDSYATTVGHIGEIKTPIDTGVITKSDLVADYYEPDKFTRLSDDDITLFKNGGGAHMDLMTARYILDRWNSSE